MQPDLVDVGNSDRRAAYVSPVHVLWSDRFLVTGSEDPLKDHQAAIRRGTAEASRQVYSRKQPGDSRLVSRPQESEATVTIATTAEEKEEKASAEHTITSALSSCWGQAVEFPR